MNGKIFTVENLDKNTFCYFHPDTEKRKEFFKAIKRFKTTEDIIFDIFTPLELAAATGVKLKGKKRLRKKKAKEMIRNAMFWNLMTELEDNGLILSKKAIVNGETEKVDRFETSVRQWLNAKRKELNLKELELSEDQTSNSGS